MSILTADPPPDSADFECDCNYFARAACKSEPFYKEYLGKKYCVLHYPDTDKSAEFMEALKRKKKAEDFNFSHVHFPGYVSFTNCHINGSAEFSDAVFHGEAHFLETYFNKGASFSNATFRADVMFGASHFKLGASFHNVTFKAKADFQYTHFGPAGTHGVSFTKATFAGEADFTDTVFDAQATFNYATFKDYVRFARESRDIIELGERPSLSFQHARFEKPERVSFHTVSLRPHWFVNADARKFDFTNVEWRGDAAEGVNALEKGQRRWQIASSYRLLARACRQLAVNEEENHRYEEASQLRYVAMDAHRRERRYGFVPWKLSWWYWLASGYGERVLRALIILLTIWFGFALIYFQARCTSSSLFAEQVCVTWEQGKASASPQEGFFTSLAYTLNVMTLQKPEPRPASPAAQMLVTFCTILGPLQAALLALAIRRKFMR
jgi:uncharacterized protein YjbI with pentapeptide repeats